MIGNLPRNFTEKMEKLLGNEYDNFMSSYDAPRVYGLRVNHLKLNVEQWKQLSPMSETVRPIPWAVDGLYYVEGERPGKHPHYHAGLYYIQEPSAMAPVELLGVKPGHRVLDLCAAPGGKSTQIAAKLQGSGVLVTNDNAKERTKALAKNIELAGVRNAVVLNEEPAALAEVFGEWFDRILVDAPCSGEGMFRKDESMIAGWEKHSVEICSVMQQDILRSAAQMLAPGGIIVYSTCTFSPEENEQQIAHLLANNEDFHVVPIPHLHGWTEGRSDLVTETAHLDHERLESISGTARLWPHRIEGEGHYVALIRRDGERVGPLSAEALAAKESGSLSRTDGGSLKRADAARGGRRSETRPRQEEARRADKHKAVNSRGNGKRGQETVADPIEQWRQFAILHELESLENEGQAIAYGSRVYIQPKNMPSLNGLRVVRAGWYVGEAGRVRFEPSHPLAMGITMADSVRAVNWSSDDPQTLRFLKGETLFVDESDVQIREGAAYKGYILVCTDGYPIGWGKYDGGMIKNELPAGWRWM